MKADRWMKLTALAAVAALAAAPALAGGTKCTSSTQDCLNHMAAKMKNSGWVGLELENDEATGTLTVKKVIEGSPAESAGVKPGDILVAMNGIEISKANHEKLYKAKEALKPGGSVTYTIKRDGYDRQMKMTLAPMPADVLARFIGQHMLEHATVETASAK